MAINSYSTLQTAVANWLARSDLTTVIPDFITLAEAEFNRTLRCKEQESRVYASATEYMELPDDFLELRDVQINLTPKIPLKLVSPQQMEDYSTASGRPVAYCVLANQIQLGPAPDSTYEIEIDYFAEIPALSDSNTSNWLLAAHPDLYLYGALLRASGYVQDGNLLAGWKQAYTEVSQQIRYADKRAKWAGPPTSIRAG